MPWSKSELNALGMQRELNAAEDMVQAEVEALCTHQNAKAILNDACEARTRAVQQLQEAESIHNQTTSRATVAGASSSLVTTALQCVAETFPPAFVGRADAPRAMEGSYRLRGLSCKYSSSAAPKAKCPTLRKRGPQRSCPTTAMGAQYGAVTASGFK
jgi:hypothetical protein